MTTRASQVTTSFFRHATPVFSFPDSYMSIWKKPHCYSNIMKIKALLKDYTKENFFLGSFLGRLFSGHWNRHHIDKIHEIIHTPYESVDDLIYDLKLLKPQKGGSLDQRIRFIDVQIEADRKDRFCSVF